MTEYFKINSIDDFVGNKLTFKNIDNIIENINNNDILLIIGPSGIGKTKFVEIVCEKYNYNFTKIDSSICSNSKVLVDRLEKLHSWTDISQLFCDKKQKIIVIDELETLIKVDRNIPSSIVKFINKRDKNIPIIMIGQYEADRRINELKKLCTKTSYLKRIEDNDMFLYLKSKISRKKIPLVDLMKIVESSNGSIYSAINSLENYNNIKSNIITNCGKDSFTNINEVFSYTDYNDIFSVIYEDPWTVPLSILETSNKVYNTNDYYNYIKGFMNYDLLIEVRDLDTDIPIGYLSQYLLIFNTNKKIKKNKIINIQFTKLLSYMSTQKKTQRLLYDKIDKNIPINEIGSYWVHKNLSNK